MDILAIAFTPAPAEQSPNLRRGRTRKAADTYYRATLVAFASAARWLEGQRLILVTDCAPPPAIQRKLSFLRVEVLLADFAHRPPEGFYHSFNASIYTLDAINALAGVPGAESILLIDPDCIVVRPIAPIFRRAVNSVMAYPLGILPSEDSNGLTSHQAAELHELLDPALTGDPAHFGGEFYGFSPADGRLLTARAELAYRLALDRASQGLTKFTTEEHLLNYALRYADVDTIDDSIRRIWTAPTHRTVTGDEDDLAIWHLPAEKDRGIAELVPAALNKSSWFWVLPDAEFRDHLGSILGLHRRTLRRMAYDFAAACARAAQRQVRR